MSDQDGARWTASLFALLLIYLAAVNWQSRFELAFFLANLPWMGPHSMYIAQRLPFLEILLAWFLFLPSTRYAGFLALLLFLSVSFFYSGYLVLFQPHATCDCSGWLSKFSWYLYWIGTTLLLLMAGIGTTFCLKMRLARMLFQPVETRSVHKEQLVNKEKWKEMYRRSPFYGVPLQVEEA